jgi:hypothetical protein
MLVGVLGQGMVHELRDERAAPNEGIRRSARSALAAALVSTVLFVLVGVLSGEPLAGPVVGLLAGLLAALLYGGGACLQHYAIRAALVRSTMAPPHYERFLEAMTQRLLLRRSGSAYLFAHRLLRDHLAAARPSTTSPTREIPSDR